MTNEKLKCPHCEKDMDGATGDVPRVPADGDYCICMYCSTILRYSGKGMDIKLIEQTPQDLQFLGITNRDMYVQLQNVVKMVTAIRERQVRQN